MTSTTTPGAPLREQGKVSIESLCDVTVVILTYNEGQHIARAIASVRSFAREIVVVDSFSTDDTIDISKAAGVRILQNKFVNQSKQFQWGLENAGIVTEWVLRLDADEIIEPDLAAVITARLPTLPADVAGVNFNRKHIFLGRWVKHGGRYPLILLRLWRTRQGRIEYRWMDEHVVVWGGRTVTFEGGFSDCNMNDLTFFTDKHNKYATREAIDVLARKYDLLPIDDALSSGSASRQARFKRVFKERIYNRLPLWGGPLLYFLYRAIVLGGIFDGSPGMIYHVLQGFWYRYLVNAKIYEYELGMADCRTRQDRLARLATLTGHKALNV